MKRMLVLLMIVIMAGPLFAGGDAEAAGGGDGPVVLELARFFGDPDDSLMDSTDLSMANSEAAAIQIITNVFNAEYEGKIRVEKLGGSEWGSYYDQLNTTFAAGDPPDVAVMHQTNMPAYASRNILIPLDDKVGAAGIDPSDWTGPAAEAVSYKGSTYGVPFDLHANLLHVNVDLFKKAGLVDGNGIPILPTSPEEFFKQAEIMKQKTGALYWVEDATQFPISFRLFHTLMEQQGESIVDTDSNTANIDSPAGRKALTFMLERFQKGYSDPNADYTAAQQLFMNGNAAIELNGTWVVDQYSRELNFKYRAMNFPDLMGEDAVWANSHMWVLPKQKTRDENYEEAMTFLAFLNDHVYEWAAGTGHIAPRASVLKTLTENNVPQRGNYAGTASIASTFPPVLKYSAIETIVKEEIEKTWLLGEDVNTVLARADARVEEVLKQ
jgi:multiple sugar transport system substrate-binding protein